MVNTIVKSICFLLTLFSCSAYSAQQGESVILRPQMRALLETNVLYTVKTEDIDQFLENVVVIEDQTKYDLLPMIIAFESGFNLGAQNEIVYVSGINGVDYSEFNILKPHKKLEDSVTKKDLGLHAKVVGRAQLLKQQDPAVLKIVSQNEQIETQYRLIPRTGLDLPGVIYATRPSLNLSGNVVSVEYETIGSGNNSIAIINLGAKDGVELGNLFDVYEPSQCIDDPRCKTKVDLPTTKFAELMVYKVLDNISLALITSAKHSVDIGDNIISTSRES